MLPKSQTKLITSLHQKKYRHNHQLFIAEGIKTITELLDSHIELQHLYTTNSDYLNLSNNCTLISQIELKKISALKTANDILGVFKMPKPEAINTDALIIALDDIRDPGNLGTIIRLCDWFGIQDLVCSIGTVDAYNPKVIQATMGSISRVTITYTNLETFLSKHTNNDVFGTFMDGVSIYAEALPSKGVIVMGNEANGVSSSVEDYTTKRLAIPRFGNLRATESLNVATATAIVLSEFKRTSIER